MPLSPLLHKSPSYPRARLSSRDVGRHFIMSSACSPLTARACCGMPPLDDLETLVCHNRALYGGPLIVQPPNLQARGLA
jgi:hypothetical protein